MIASVAGSSLNEYVNVAGALHLQEGIAGVEVYLSCPDDEREGEPFYSRSERLIEIVGAVARLSRVPVFAKLPAFVPGIVETAQACVRAGAFGLTLIDGLMDHVSVSRARTGTVVCMYRDVHAAS